MLIKNVKLLFFAISGLHLLCCLTDREDIAPYTKVLLMPLLAYYYWVAAKPEAPIFSLLAALFFSWGGDTLLIFARSNPNFFLAGLASFFVAHAFYVYTFVKKGSRPKSDFMTYSILIISILTVINMMLVLLPNVATAMQVPVIGYGIILNFLLLSSLCVRKLLAGRWFLLFLGAVLFVSSDALIAFSRFMPEAVAAIPSKSFLIMLTYIAAQYLMISSFVWKKIG